MIGSTAGQCANALSLAASASGGLFQYYYDQTEEKRLIVGRAARTAVESAMLGRAGELGPGRALEGQAGLFRMFGGAAGPSAEVVVAGLEQREGPLFIYPKFYSASHSIIPTLDGLRDDLPPNFDASAIKAFVVHGDPGFATIMGAKVDKFEPPTTVIGAMINYSYVVALQLIHGSVLPHDYTAERLRDPRILELASKGRFERAAAGSGVSIELQMQNGRGHLVKARLPDPRRPAPLQREERLTKFNALTAGRLSPAAQARLQRACLELPQVRSMRAWTTQTQQIVGSA
jgi:2-methylcitrate dehydratase PrpD